MNTRTIEQPVRITQRVASELRVMLAHRIAQCEMRIGAGDDPSGYWQDEMTRAHRLMRDLTIEMEK